MVEWFNESFAEHSIAWLLIASLLGGSIPLVLKFVFEEVFKFRLGKRRELRKVVSYYSSPLLRTGISLERRVNNLIRNIDQDWYTQEDPYYKISTLYTFGAFLAWVRILEREKNFLEFHSTKKSKAFDKRLYGIFRPLTSFVYFKEHQDLDKVGKSVIPRLMLTGIGEAMILEKGDEDNVLDFSSFVEQYYEEPNKFRWFQALDDFLLKAKENPIVWDRLIILQAHLKHFILLLDKKNTHIRDREYHNLELLKDPTAKRILSDWLGNN